MTKFRMPFYVIMAINFTGGLMDIIVNIAKKAKNSASIISKAGTVAKNKILKDISNKLR